MRKEVREGFQQSSPSSIIAILVYIVIVIGVPMALIYAIIWACMKI